MEEVQFAKKKSRTTWRSTCRARPCRPHGAARDELRRMNAEGGRQPQTEFLSDLGNMAASIFRGAQKPKILNVKYRCSLVFCIRVKFYLAQHGPWTNAQSQREKSAEPLRFAPAKYLHYNNQYSSLLLS